MKTRIFLRLLQESVIMRSVLALSVLLMAGFIWLQTRDVPDWLQIALTAILTFYFTSHVPTSTREIISEEIETWRTNSASTVSDR